MRDAWLRAWLRSVHAVDRVRWRARVARHPGLTAHQTTSPNFAFARLRIAPGGRLTLGAGAVTERRKEWLNIVVHEDAEVVVEDGAWLRTEIAPVVLVAFPGARLHIGPRCLLNGCWLSAKQEVRLDTEAMVGPNSKVLDSDQHDFDTETPERTEPIAIGAHAWVASDVTVTRGVTIGAHSIIGTRSVVTKSVPDHRVAFGIPAAVRGEVGDRTGC